MEFSQFPTQAYSPAVSNAPGRDRVDMHDVPTDALSPDVSPRPSIDPFDGGMDLFGPIDQDDDPDEPQDVLDGDDPSYVPAGGDSGEEGEACGDGGDDAADNLPAAGQGLAESEVDPSSAQDADVDGDPWESDIYKAGPQLTGALTLEIAREQCKDWAHHCGFNLVQKSADRRLGKATFRCSCKGRKFTGGGRDESADPEIRRARPVTYALPGEDLCPFQ